MLQSGCPYCLPGIRHQYYISKGIGVGLIAAVLLLVALVSPAAAQSIYGTPMGGGSSPYGHPMVQNVRAHFSPFHVPFAFRVVKVHFGDTLSEIAADFHVSQKALLRANPRIEDPDLIFAGQKLVVPFRSFFHFGYRKQRDTAR